MLKASQASLDLNCTRLQKNMGKTPYTILHLKSKLSIMSQHFLFSHHVSLRKINESEEQVMTCNINTTCLHRTYLLCTLYPKAQNVTRIQNNLSPGEQDINVREKTKMTTDRQCSLSSTTVTLTRLTYNIKTVACG